MNTDENASRVYISERFEQGRDALYATYKRTAPHAISQQSLTFDGHRKKVRNAFAAPWPDGWVNGGTRCWLDGQVVYMSSVVNCGTEARTDERQLRQLQH